MEHIENALFQGYIRKTGISTSMQIFLEVIEQYLPVDYLYFSIGFRNIKNGNTHILFEHSPRERELNIELNRQFKFSKKFTERLHKHNKYFDGVCLQRLEDFEKIFIDDSKLYEEAMLFNPIFKSVITMTLVDIPDEYVIRLGIRSLKAGTYTEDTALKFRKFYAPARELALSILHNRSEAIYSSSELAAFTPLSKQQMILQCKGLSSLRNTVSSVSVTDSNVLILGETGCGKDVLAEAIHESSPFLTGPFINANCSALYDNLLEAALFGYEKGSFTGAYNQHKGLFEQANNGTIFLNEIGELSLAAQAKLLTVLETHTVLRMGSQHPISLRFRLICATNRDLPSMVKRGVFRADLWYRINTIQIYLPPLRQRREDIITLARYFTAMFASSLHMGYVPIIPDVLKIQLMEMPWHGNVRELRNWIERACIRTKWEKSQKLLQPEEQFYTLDYAQNEKMTSMEKAHIEECLAKCNGKIQGKSSAAEMLGLKGSTLRARMRKLGIPFSRQKNDD